jgi:hypothetical protein
MRAIHFRSRANTDEEVEDAGNNEDIIEGLDDPVPCAVSQDLYSISVLQQQEPRIASRWKPIWLPAILGKRRRQTIGPMQV